MSETNFYQIAQTLLTQGKLLEAKLACLKAFTLLESLPPVDVVGVVAVFFGLDFSNASGDDACLKALTLFDNLPVPPIFVVVLGLDFSNASGLDAF